MQSLAIVATVVLLSWSTTSLGTEENLAPGGEASAASSARDDTAAARAVVESFHEVLLGSMKEADEIGFRGRYDRIAASLDETFDLPFMARTLVGATWKELSQEQHDEFIALSRRLSASRYADNFDSYGGQRFETHSEEPAARGTIVVKTELIQPKDRNVLFDYRLREVEGRWRIIDIYLDGMISELVLWRSQYRSLIENEGFAALVETLEKRVDELQRE
jgi:phospholipid transport system substrate-binding protein